MPLSRPEPIALLMPVLKVTLMLPASATRPDAVTAALPDAIWPLLMPMATVEPLPQVWLDDAMRTFHVPSNVEPAASACASGTTIASIVTKRPLRKPFMTRPCWLTVRGNLSRERNLRCEDSHTRRALCEETHKSKRARITGPLSHSKNLVLA